MPDITETEALAQQLYELYREAYGRMLWQWEQLQPKEREAWIQVAEYVEKRGDTEVPDHK